MEQSEQNQILFMQLVMQNQQIALMSLGKMNNPVTNKPEKNIEMAKIIIDTLEMLKEKTKGNLSDYEEKFLVNTLNELKILFVEEQNKS